ncbi:hypothetical protein J6590_098373, partial [Homalodisca vitripennis]
ASYSKSAVSNGDVKMSNVSTRPSLIAPEGFDIVSNRDETWTVMVIGRNLHLCTFFCLLALSYVSEHSYRRDFWNPDVDKETSVATLRDIVVNPNTKNDVSWHFWGHAALTLRSRLRCIIMRKNEEVTKAKPPSNLLVLNEVVIDRGPSPYLSNIDLFLDGKHITSVQGDGLIVSTPTGSTAYAVAAGASMIHPSVPAIMVTPICPHSLSFRPIVVPAGVELKISVSPDSRNTAWVSFDGRNRQELFHGDRYQSGHVTACVCLSVWSCQGT